MDGLVVSKSSMRRPDTNSVLDALLMPPEIMKIPMFLPLIFFR